MPCERGGIVCAVALATGLLIFIKRVGMDVDYPQQPLLAPSTGNLLLINDQDVGQEAYFCEGIPHRPSGTA